MDPSAATAAGPVLVRLRSASSPTAVVTWFAAAEPLLLLVSGSAVAASARATLTSVPVAGAVTVTVRLTLLALARLPTTGQLTTPPDSLPPSLANPNVTPAGSVSAMATAVAVDGPLFVTVIV